MKSNPIRAAESTSAQNRNSETCSIDWLPAFVKNLKAIAKAKAYLHGLLTEESDELVQAVKTALEDLGFSNVIDLDREAAGNLQEDLRIAEEGEALLLVEVKGTQSVPKEKHISQLTKFMLRQSKKSKPKAIGGLLVVNHQRNLPPLKRRHGDAFTAEQEKDAIESDIGLWTTWDLFLLLRGMAEWNWDTSDLRPLLYKPGRFARRPGCYEDIGEVDNFFSAHSAVSVKLSASISIGDTLCYILEDRYYEEKISNMQVDRKDVETAAPGQSAGVVTSLERKHLRDGTKVYRRSDLLQTDLRKK